MTLATHLSIYPTSIMCFEYILVVSQQCSYIKCRRQCNLAHLRSAPPLLYPSLSLWASGTVSMWSTKQILFPLLLPKVHLASGFVQKTRQPLLRSLKTSPSLTPTVRLGRVEVLVFSFLTNTQLILPYATITHWNLMLLL